MAYIVILLIYSIPGIIALAFKLFTKKPVGGNFQFIVIVLTSYGIYAITLFIFGASGDVVDLYMVKNCIVDAGEPQSCKDFVLSIADFWISWWLYIGFFIALVFQLPFLHFYSKKKIFNKASHAKN